MDVKPKFNIVYSADVIDFLNSLTDKAKAKILYNINKSKYVVDKKIFKKLENSEIWEFRTLYNGVQYRVFAFWDNNTDTLVITTHGMIKKTQKTPKKDIERAESIRKEYLKNK